MRLSDHQQQILARLAAGWTLEFLNTSQLKMRTPDGSTVCVDGRSVQGLWDRKFIRMPDRSNWQLVITDAGRAALKGDA